MTDQSDNIPLHAECCLCFGQTTILSASSAHIVFNNREYRVYYHKICFETNPKAKEIITAKLQVLIK